MTKRYNTQTPAATMMKMKKQFHSSKERIPLAQRSYTPSPSTITETAEERNSFERRKFSVGAQKFETGENVFVVDSRDSEVNYVYLNYNIFFAPLLIFSARLLQTVINWLRDNYDIIAKIHNAKFFKPNGGDDDYGFMAELT
jgi:hypothetical protein